ncbi:MAG: hypothetical protein EA382_12980 [Spirochaetaceae bacterium]|nr:MAG: hypothetical protein EA382_12980 [Spirochaetaceae bacterium]
MSYSRFYRSIRGAALVSATLVGATLLVLAVPDAPADELWSQAVSLHREYGTLVPGRMQIRFQQYNARNRLISDDESEVRIFVDASGEVSSEIVFARQNGRDVTAERQRNPSGSSPFGPPQSGSTQESDGNAFSGLLKSPFDPDEQSQVTFLAGSLDEINGTRARKYSFRHDTGASSITVGTAWLSLSDGMPLRISLQLEPTPRFVDEFTMVQSFARDAVGRWVNVLTTFEGSGSFLFLRRRIESTFVFSEYFAPD